jgi:hypothetical protein
VIKFQVMLHEIIMKHKAGLCVYDDICHLVTEYTWSPSFNRYAKLKSQKSFLRSMQETHSTHELHPKNFNVRLHTGTMVTVPIFDTKEMIINILTDKTLMTDKNFAEGYNVWVMLIQIRHVMRNTERYTLVLVMLGF